MPFARRSERGSAEKPGYPRSSTHSRSVLVILGRSLDPEGNSIHIDSDSFASYEIDRRALMIITTMNDLPGYRIDEVIGEVFGLTVRSRNLGSQIGAGLKSLVGGELKGMTKMLAEGRIHAQQRLEEEAAARGADAVIAFRFDTSELGGTWTEICAYGTAVKTTPV
jgi:uncharacterized protein YbjQ (UPF0145 family)